MTMYPDQQIPDEIKYCLKTVRQENINFKNIDFKTKTLIRNTYTQQQKHLVTPRFAFTMVAILLTTVTFFSSINIYQKHQQQIALEKIQNERAEVFPSDYIYTTLVDSYQ